MTDLTIPQKLHLLRQALAEAGADYYYVPSTDPHHSEYTPACWQRRAWVSDFTGSAGEVIIGQEAAYLFTDGRYFLQAEAELDPACYTLMKQMPGLPTLPQWLAQQKTGVVVAVDPALVSMAELKRFEKALTQNQGRLLAIDDNWVDRFWNARPLPPTESIRLYPVQHAGLSRAQKLTMVRDALREKQANALVVSALDAIAWLYNIRGNDVQHTPVVIAFAIVTTTQAYLFVDVAKVKTDVRCSLTDDGVILSDYTEFSGALSTLSGSVWVDPTETSWSVARQLCSGTFIQERSPIALLKAIKTPEEQAGFREAHRLDALAVVTFLQWLETEWSLQRVVTEQQAARQLDALRLSEPRCLDLSFPTISGFGAHGAIVHYRADDSSDCVINDASLYLVDSGGQYWEGTTDITRTIHLGVATHQQRQHYTQVLKGHLALRHAVFPMGTCGEQLDVLARAPLWYTGLNYNHGTGHGVGCYLGVHEGPQGISPRASGVSLQPGMVVSNEPGFYLDGQYGIRIENLCLVIKSAYAGFYAFEDLTWVPYARQLIDCAALSATEINWINDYHQQVYALLSPALSQPVKAWLREATQPLGFHAAESNISNPGVGE